MLITFLGPIAKLSSVCNGCYVGTAEENNCYLNQVGIIVLTWFRIQSAVKTVECIDISFVVLLYNSRYDISELACSGNWMIYG